MSDKNNENDNATISRRSGYTAIPNHIFSDVRLSLDARAFLGLVMSMKEGWVFRRKNLMDTSGIGRDKYIRIVKELQAAGYLEIHPVHGDDGRFIGNNWVVNDDPLTQDVDTEGLKTRTPVTGGLKTRTPVLPAVGETRPHKKNNSNKNTNLKDYPQPPKGGGRSFGIPENVKRILESQQ